MKRIVFCVSLIALVAAGCSQKPAANTGSSPTPKSAASTTSASPKAEKKAPSTNPVPADWIRMHDDAKGYEFQVPQGTKDAQDTKDGVDVYMANVPAPYDIGVMVVAFKDKTLSKEDLIKKAEDILKAFEEKDIKIEPAKELSNDYSLSIFTSTGKDGKPGKGKILVATDVTDNYIMFVGGDADKFASNEKTIDEIWGSFGMYSGGFSGNS
ncbi:MAG: hypothetical protein DMF72_07125 [Acidobacteria bacterium]|nr:MAG: hypothetical protein DMF72_07125 [Acidobacteriota bacterium]